MIEKFFSKISIDVLKTTITLVILFMAVDGLISIYALDNFLARVSEEKNIKIIGVEDDERSSKIASNLFPDKKMMMTYPKMLVVFDKNEIVQLEKILSNVKIYYY